jgi:hypothetical protein
MRGGKENCSKRCGKETKKRGGKTELHVSNHLVDRQKPIVHAPEGEPSSLISAKNLLDCLYSDLRVFTSSLVELASES